MNSPNSHFACFFLSTGRCGTQWLAVNLQKAFGDRLCVEHEPIHNDYSPWQILGAQDPGGTDNPQRVLAHLDHIERCLESKPYIECGHPCWAAVPYLAKRFEGRVRVVHLTRHPVPTACSWLTHSAYCPPFLPHQQEKVLLSPFDVGVAFPQVQPRWEQMNPFDKCLYYWAEVNALGLRLEGEGHVPWLRLKYEDLFDGDGLEHLMSYLGLPHSPTIVGARKALVDTHHFVTDAWWDVRAAERHTPVVEVARALGYDLLAVDYRALRRRYWADGA